MKAISVLAIGCFVFLLLASSGCTNPLAPPAGNATGNGSSNATLAPMPGVKSFGSASELKAFLEKNTMQGYYGGYDMVVKGGIGVPMMAPTAAAGPASPEGGTPSYSGTNIQVAGVDEADFVKSDGKYLYIISGQKLVIVDAYPAGGARKVSETAFGKSGGYYGSKPQLFVNGDELVVLSDGGYGSETTLLQYDVSDRSAPVLKKNISVDGSYFDSRMIGNHVYVVVNKPAYRYCYEAGSDCGPQPPVIAAGGKNVSGAFPEIYYFDEPAYSFTYTTVLSLDLLGAKQEPDYAIFLSGASDNMYVSNDSIYLAYERVPDYVVAMNDPLAQVGQMILPAPEPAYQLEETGIRRIAISSGKVRYAAGGHVPGRVLNQFSMDEHNGYFRVATTEGHVARSAGEATARNNVYVLDSSMNVTGKAEGLAPGEQIYSARFMGDRAYLVTFRKVDPLFVLDMSDPKEPKVLGKLKIPGYSDYLHPYDETHLIGFGKDAMPSEEGDFSWYQGLKISLFDVSDVSNPKELANYKMGDRGSDSYALSDHKAFLFDKSKNLLVVPVLEAKLDKTRYAGGAVDPWQYGDYVFQGAYVFNISVAGGIALRGRISHLDSNDTLVKSGYYYDSPFDVKRSMYIGETLYTVSDKLVKANSLEDLSNEGAVPLPYAEPAYGYYYGV